MVRSSEKVGNHLPKITALNYVNKSVELLEGQATLNPLWNQTS